MGITTSTMPASLRPRASPMKATTEMVARARWNSSSLALWLAV